MEQSTYSSDTARWAAVTARDIAAEGYFVYCVRTTGIYCRPTCKARLARRANVEFFRTVHEAKEAGYRACKRCKPELANYVPESDQMIKKVRVVLENLPQGRPLPKLGEMAAQAGLTKYHFHRQFKRATGLTPREYALAWRKATPSASISGSIVTTGEPASNMPSLLKDNVSASTSTGTPTNLHTPEFVPDSWMEDWLVSEFDDPMLSSENAARCSFLNGYVEEVVPKPVAIDIDKELMPADLTTLRVHYSTVETTHGVLVMAFEEEQISKLQLVGTTDEAIALLAASFPPFFYSINSVDELPTEQRNSLLQRILAVVQALETPHSSSLNLQNST